MKHSCRLQEDKPDRVAELIGGLAANVTPLERELIALIKKSFEIPARLKPSDLDQMRKIVDDDVLDYLLVIASFHFVNRIADLLDVPLEGLPKPLRRFELSATPDTVGWPGSCSLKWTWPIGNII